MLIDDYMPAFDVSERHHVKVRASLDEVYAQVRRLDMSDAKLMKLLFRLRGLPTPRRLMLDDMLKTGFGILDERVGEEFLLGLVGRFWTPSGNIIRVKPENFREFDRSGYAKAAWNFSLTPDENGTVQLTTETRVQCTDKVSRRQFRLYWMLIGSFSGLIRKEMLRTLKRNAENSLRYQSAHAD
jgi:hypothetical protein